MNKLVSELKSRQALRKTDSVMRCPLCGGPTFVNDSRAIGDRGNGVRRRRACLGACNYRFTTYEIAPGPGGVEPRTKLAQDLAVLAREFDAFQARLKELSTMATILNGGQT